MAKQPYLKFYLGDYIKDTRILPLNVRGAWTDLILFMWDNDPKGEISGTIEDFSRLMCCSVEEANLVIQTLKQRKIFDYADLGGGIMKIISRKQKGMAELSEIRSKVGKNGGNPALTQPKEEYLLNQKDNQNHEYEYESKGKIDDSKEGVGEKKEERKGEPKAIGPQMVKVFMDAFPDYPVDQNLDFAACLEISYKIATANGWTKDSVVNGKQASVLSEWMQMVDFIKSDKWYSTRSISAINKQFQDLAQAIKNGRTTHKSGNIGGTPVVQNVTQKGTRKF